jgi:hypothetical protein
MAQLAVYWDGQRVGHLDVARREGFCIFGRFVPEAGVELCRAEFEEAYQGDAAYAAAAVAAGGDVFQTDRSRFHAAIAAITERVSLPELGEPVEELNIFADNEVEVYLPEPDA